jgi:hypothetical protein
VSPNANTTGLAGQAFRAGMRLRKAKAFVAGPQGGLRGAAAGRGATGSDPATVVRATTQAVLGLGGRGLAQLTSAGSSVVEPALTCP